MKQNNQRANQLNANKGTPGVNKDYAHVQGNRGKQKNTNAPQVKVQVTLLKKK